MTWHQSRRRAWARANTHVVRAAERRYRSNDSDTEQEDDE